MDKARVQTDRKLRKVEKKLNKIYAQAEHEIYGKWDAYMERQAKKLAVLQKEYDDLIKAGKKDEARELSAKLKQKKQSVLLRNDEYKSMAQITADNMAKVNATALAYVNGVMPEIYILNYNAVAGAVKEIGGISFNLVNQNAVKYMVMKNPNLIPRKTFNKYKDVKWNLKRINSSVLQGIIQGESIPKIAKRLEPIFNNNKASAVRNARTLVTSVENKGKLDSFEKLEEDGAVIKKIWVATGDDRTRDWHLSMDGQEVDLDEDFEDGLGNSLAYPGDPNGEPETVYNCRCAMKPHIIGFRKPDGRIVEIEREQRENIHDKEIEQERKRRADG